MKTVLDRIAGALSLSPGCFEELREAQLITTSDFINHVRHLYRRFPCPNKTQFASDAAYVIYRDLFADERPDESRPVLYGAWFACRAIARLLIDEQESLEIAKGGQV